MRVAFIKTLSELAAHDPDVMLLTGDLGFSVFEDFIKRYPRQYLNVGVAEQDLIGVSSGLALTGKKVVAYSISTFASMRPVEQIRDDVCYQNLPVVIVGVGSTFSYSTFGCTHMPLEDLGIMRTLPNMSVLCPGDPVEVVSLLRSAVKSRRPAYMRIGKKGEPVIHSRLSDVVLGKVSELKRGKDATIIVTGRQLPNAVAAANMARSRGIDTGVVSCHTLKPLDSAGILRAIRGRSIVLTCEEHNVIGGLGSAVAEVIAHAGITTRFISLGVTDEFPSGVGSQEYFLEKYDLTADGIARRLERALHAKR